jgi:hypothetical protein
MTAASSRRGEAGDGRKLSAKVFAGQCRPIDLGFRQRGALEYVFDAGSSTMWILIGLFTAVNPRVHSKRILREIVVSILEFNIKRRVTRILTGRDTSSSAGPRQARGIQGLGQG